MIRTQPMRQEDQVFQCTMEHNSHAFLKHNDRTKWGCLLIALLIVLGISVSISPVLYAEFRLHWTPQTVELRGQKIAWGTITIESIDTEPCELHHPQSAQSACWEVSSASRIDCYPEPGASQESCEARGCCWEAPDQNAGGTIEHLGVPMCFYPIDYGTYTVSSYNETETGFRATLQKINTGISDRYPNVIKHLQLIASFHTNERLHLKIFDPEQKRYEVPYPKLASLSMTKAENPAYEVKMSKGPFAFKVIRKSNGQTLFDSSAGAFHFYDQYIEVTSYLHSKYIYGLGEHTDRLLHPTDYSRFTFWASDVAPGINLPLYGTQPFFVGMDDEGKSHGVLLFNSNAMDVILSPAPAITYRTIGGILDFYFFLGPSPGDVVAQYTELVGRPALPPYWSLGFHLCKYGYGSLDRTKEVMQRNIDAGIPLDVQWNDIDYMNGSKDFTINQDSFSGVKQFVHALHERGMHYVVITDPGISAVEPAGTYAPFDDGVAMGTFVRNASGGILLGKVWTGGLTAYPDFTHPNATKYWTKQVSEFHQKMAFDGLWIDMNEPSNFVDGSVNGCPQSILEDPPYLPHMVNNAVLRQRTICLTARHFAGLSYNLHNLYGLTEAMVTRDALTTVRPNKRPFIISRSTFVGQGKYSGHWSGDVPSTWESLQRSIPSILNFNMFGIPLVGADICGFNGNTTKELCQRWQELGAFYPFSRNHNSLGNMDQDPASLGEDVIASSRKALLVRYQLLPVYYTLFYHASTKGETVVRPLFFEFPEDRTTFEIDWQFLVGRHLMVSPVLTPDTIEIDAYFPAGRWYDFYTGREDDSEDQWVTLSAPLDTINLHVRGGAILPTQKPEQTTTATRTNPFTLLVALNDSHEASGDLYWDDGDQLDVLESKNYSYIIFRMQTSPPALVSNVEVENYKDMPKLDGVIVFGAGVPHSVLVDGDSWDFTVDKDTKVLKVDQLELDLLKPFRISFVY